MDWRLSRRSVLQAAAVAGSLLAPTRSAPALPRSRKEPEPGGWVTGRLTGAEAVVAVLQQHHVGCVYGIPGAQENELWDAFKTAHLPYLLVTHEFSAACMADGYARATGCPGVIAVVPGPGLTNSLTGLGEALLDSVPIVALVGDVGNGAKAHAFQVHGLDNVALLRPVCKDVFAPKCVGEIPGAVRQAFALAQSGEPGPVGVVIPYNLLIEAADLRIPPPEAPTAPFDSAAIEQAVALLSQCKGRIGIYAGYGCMAYSEQLVRVAEKLEAPVATSVSGKGAFPETHPLSVGWGYGPQATRTAQMIFQEVECLLAIGVKYSEVSTGYYSNPRPCRMIHVDARPENIGRVLRPDVCVAADAGMFLGEVLARPCPERKPDARLRGAIQQWKCAARADWQRNHGKCGVDPMLLILALRRCLAEDALLFVDVALAEHYAAEAYTVCRPRTYCCPTDNQAMGWSVPAAIGAQSVSPGRCVVSLTGDGCFLMSAMETSTAARTGLPVKFFVLDNQVYQYMQELQEPAYRQTTATVLARLDYCALAKAFGLGYAEVTHGGSLDAQVQAALSSPGPTLVRVITDYGDRECRWIEAVRKKYVKELSFEQKSRFLRRVGKRTLDFKPPLND